MERTDSALMHATRVENIQDTRTASTDAPPLPEGTIVHLPGRGPLFVRQVPGPAGAPVVILLHGWTTTADLNWHASYAALGEHFRVIAFDHRGHGRGLQCGGGFRLEDCADDAADVAAALGIDRFIPVGYSMGGPIASLVWRRHRNRVHGLVLCSTARHFNDTPSRRVLFTMLNGTSAIASTPPLRALNRFSASAWARHHEHRGDAPWMVEQLLLHDWTQILAAGRAIGQFDSRSWAGEIDVPTAVIVSLDDEVVPTTRQFEMAKAVPGALLHTVSGGHAACLGRDGEFASSLLSACQSVAARAA